MNPTTPIQFGQIYITDATIENGPSRCHFDLGQFQQHAMSLKIQLTAEDIALAPVKEYADRFVLHLSPNRQVTLTTNVSPMGSEESTNQTVSLTPKSITPLLSKITQGVTLKHKTNLQALWTAIFLASGSDRGTAQTTYDQAQRETFTHVNLNKNTPTLLREVFPVLRAFEQWVLTTPPAYKGD